MAHRRFEPRPPLLLLVLALAAPVVANSPPSPADGVAFEQRLDVEVPLELSFRDERGSAVRLGDLLGKRPAILALVYYECPMLCTRVLDGLLRSLRKVPFDAGEEFEVIVVSIDPGEGPDLAAAKKTSSLERYGRPGTAGGWHFLTGAEESVRALADTVGFRYRYDAASDQYAHASGIIVLTPAGKTARYFFGIEYSPRSVRLSLVEAAAERIGSVVDQILLLCFQWDPSRGKYGFAVVTALRIAGLATVATLGLLLVVLLRRERRERPAREGESR